MWTNRAFYLLKPFIPRRLQIQLRRMRVLQIIKSCEKIWPIDERSARKPMGDWSGWPEGKRFALVLTHDVETEKGQAKCHNLIQLEKQLGFRSSFNFVPKRYDVSPELRHYLTDNGFEVGVHGLYHDGKYYNSRRIFRERAEKVNEYLRDWKAVGFRSPSMLSNLEWIHDLNVEYDSSTFDTDPVEPHPAGVHTIFPFWVSNNGSNHKGYVELPYTLPQDFTLFILMNEKTIDIWKKKLDWIVENGGMALLNTHPDYMNFGGKGLRNEQYPMEYYEEFLTYIQSKYKDLYWHALPRDMARFWSKNYGITAEKKPGLPQKSAKPFRQRRICMLAYTYYEMDSRVKRYAESLVKRGDHVDVIALNQKGYPKHETFQGVHVYRIQKRVINERKILSYFSKITVFLINSFIRLTVNHLKKPYDLIHVHSVPDFEVFAALIPKLMGAKIVLDIHDIVPEFYASKFNSGRSSLTLKFLILIERLSIAFSDHVIISNDIWYRTLTSRSADEQKCSVILNYPNLNVFYRRLPSQNNGKFVLIYPGSINWHQGLDIAVKAFSLIKDLAPEAEFHIYGNGDSKKNIVDLTSQLGLEGRVLFKDSLPIEKIADIMGSSDLGVVPKRANAFGNDAFSTKTLEFMALGVPVVISRTKIDQFYFDESLVTFFESENEKDLAEKILFLIKEKQIRERQVASALKYIEENNWDVKQKIYFDMVDSLLAGDRS